MANGSADTTARLENWFWTQSPPGLIGEIFDDPPPRSWPDGASTRTSNVSELEQRGAAEGKIIVTVTGRRYLLGKAATHASLAAERDDAQREADELREQLEALQAAQPAVVAAGLKQKKRPRGRAPAGYGWDEQQPPASRAASCRRRRPSRACAAPGVRSRSTHVAGLTCAPRATELCSGGGSQSGHLAPRYINLVTHGPVLGGVNIINKLTRRGRLQRQGLVAFL